MMPNSRVCLHSFWISMCHIIDQRFENVTSTFAIKHVSVGFAIQFHLTALVPAQSPFYALSDVV